MSNKDTALIIGGVVAAAVAGYALAPKEVKDKISDTLGGGTVIDLSGLNIGGGATGDSSGGGLLSGVGNSFDSIFSMFGQSVQNGFNIQNDLIANMKATFDQTIADLTGRYDTTITDLTDQFNIKIGEQDNIEQDNIIKKLTDSISGVFTGDSDGGGGSTFKDNVNAVSDLISQSVPLVITGFAGSLALKFSPAIASGLKPLLSGLGTGGGSLLSNTGAAAGNIIKAAGSGISSGARIIGTGAANIARGAASVAGIAAGSPLIAGFAAAGAGIGAGLLLNQTPAGQALLANSAEAGAKTANAVISGNANALQSVVGAITGWNNTAKLNTAATDKAFASAGLTTAQVSSMVSAGMTPAQIVAANPPAPAFSPTLTASQQAQLAELRATGQTAKGGR